MERVSVREMPIGVNAYVRYKGCDVKQWMEFDNEIVRVRLVSGCSAACVLKSGRIKWARLNELERVPLQEIQPCPAKTLDPLRDTVHEWKTSDQQVAPAEDLSPPVPKTTQEKALSWLKESCQTLTQPLRQTQRESQVDGDRRTIQEQIIDPSRRTTVREMPITWRGFKPW